MLTDEQRTGSFAAAMSRPWSGRACTCSISSRHRRPVVPAAQQGTTVTGVEREPCVLAAARAALSASVADRVTLAHADACPYTPTAPVDGVLREMMHVGSCARSRPR